MQIEVQDAEVLLDVVDAVLEHLKDAKEHTEGCPSVSSAEMLTEVVADYDYRTRVLSDVQRQLRGESV